MSSLTRNPLSQYSPWVGVSRQPMRFIIVDLPDPEGPMMATNSPFRMVRSTPRRACTVSEPITYCRSMFRVTMMASRGTSEGRSAIRSEVSSRSLVTGHVR